MYNILSTESKIKQIIDELKALSAQAGLANQGEEERIITSVFLYKFLNDKFMHSLSKFGEEIGESIDEILKNENDELDAFYASHEYVQGSATASTSIHAKRPFAQLNLITKDLRTGFEPSDVTVTYVSDTKFNALTGLSSVPATTGSDL